MIASVVSMLIAIVTFAWSYMNYKMLKNEKGA